MAIYGPMSKSPAQIVVEEAIRVCGSLKAVAKRLGIKSQAISQWQKIPAKRVLALEALTGVSRHVMRPDIYGPPPSGERRAGGRQRVAA
jgi:DNA-binding transcriptional regulator YdaS (Cro superfamily)